MEEMRIFIERCLKDLENPENEQKVKEILEGLYSDVIEDGEPPEVRAVNKLREIGEFDIAKQHLYPIVAQLLTEYSKEGPEEEA